MLTTGEIGALEGIDPAAMLAQVESWAAINSGSANLQGLAAMALRLSDAFAVLPGDIELVDPAPVEVMSASGALVASQHGRHLVQRVRPEAPVQLLLTGHMDTVYGVDNPFQALFWPAPGVLNGPGVADMKGGLAVMLAALEALERHPSAARLGYAVLIDSDEEVGSPSSCALIARLAQHRAAALTYEPALPDGTLVGARGGSGNFSIRVTGRSAHAGRNPDEGRNALVAAADLAVRLKRSSRHAGESGALAINPARIEGGGPNNVVPAHAVLRVNFRPQTPEDQADAEALLDRLCQAIAREHDVAVAPHGGFGRPPKPVDSRTRALQQLVERCGADLAQPVAWRATGGVCDGNNIAAAGVPVIDTMGVRGGAIHSPEEYLIVESLEERARLSALTLIRLAEGALS